MQQTRLRLGTRGSPLAMAQAVDVKNRLIAAHNFDEKDVEIVTIKTSGDIITDRPLRDVGGKGLFTKEIEEALFTNRIDLAVHSMKDVETTLPDGLDIAAILSREDARDAFISLDFANLYSLPEGARVGSSSLRRRAQLKRARPDLEILEFRGNVGTRLEKLKSGLADATLLACAGLNRLGLQDTITEALDIDTLLPAVAQGAVGIEIRSEDNDTRQLVAPLNDKDTDTCVRTERAFLKVLDGSCRTPIAGLATLKSDTVTFTGETLAVDGSAHLRVTKTGHRSDATQLGEQAAQDLLERGARALMS